MGVPTAGILDLDVKREIQVMPFFKVSNSYKCIYV